MENDCVTGSGNVFLDLGLANPDLLLVKAEILSRVVRQTKDFSPEKLKELGIPASLLSKGGLNEDLVFMLQALRKLGNKIDIIIQNPDEPCPLKVRM